MLRRSAGEGGRGDEGFARRERPGLVSLCQSTPSVFEGTLSAFEETLSAFEGTLSAFEETPSAFEGTLSAFE
jgi:hypothetical protein